MTDDWKKSKKKSTYYSFRENLCTPGSTLPTIVVLLFVLRGVRCQNINKTHFSKIFTLLIIILIKLHNMHFLRVKLAEAISFVTFPYHKTQEHIAFHAKNFSSSIFPKPTAWLLLCYFWKMSDSIIWHCPPAVQL